jgi:hypothetical protein
MAPCLALQSAERHWYLLFVSSSQTFLLKRVMEIVDNAFADAAFYPRHEDHATSTPLLEQGREDLGQPWRFIAGSTTNAAMSRQRTALHSHAQQRQHSTLPSWFRYPGGVDQTTAMRRRKKSTLISSVARHQRFPLNDGKHHNFSKDPCCKDKVRKGFAWSDRCVGNKTIRMALRQVEARL